MTDFMLFYLVGSSIYAIIIITQSLLFVYGNKLSDFLFASYQEFRTIDLTSKKASDFHFLCL